METCGKLIVATNNTEQERIEALYERATANGLRLERIDRRHLRELEPNISGLSALLSPETGMVSYQRVARKMAEVIQAGGGEIRVGVRVDRIVERADDVEIGSADATWQARQLIVCAGIQADRLAKIAGLEIDFRMVPFRGEYYKLPPTKNNIVSHHIYPAPDPSLPFLGIHLTRMIDGGVTVGPNAVVGLSRENYSKAHINLADVASYASFPGFWRLIGKHAGHAAGELANSVFKRTYLGACQKYCPGLTLEDLLPYQAGIRAQAVMKDGVAVHDFLFAETSRTLHVCNAPSPAATSSIPIGRMIASKVIR
jgi:L-2-hydroxyglutarate oxidase